MRVPIYEPQVTPQEGQAPALPNRPSPPPSAFGTETAAATERVGQQVGGMADVLNTHIIERERMMQRAAVIQADSLYKTRVQDGMFATDPVAKPDPSDPTKTIQVPKGVFNRMGYTAHGAVEDFDQTVVDAKAAALASVATPFQKTLLSEKINEDVLRYRELVAHHEGTQTRVAMNGDVLGHNDIAIKNAPVFVNDPKGLISSIESEQQVLHDNLRDNGVGLDRIGNQISGLAGRMVRSAISSALLEDPSKAQNLLDRVSADPKNPLSLQDQDAIQKIIDVATTQHAARQKKALAISTNETEATIAGDMASGKLTPLALDQARPNVSPEFYKLASQALAHPPADDETQANRYNSKFTALLQQYSHISNEADPDKRTAVLMQFRRSVLANAGSLAPAQFNKLLGWTDPAYVETVAKKDPSKWSAALNFIVDHAKRYGGDAFAAASKFLDHASSAAPEDIPAVAQDAVKTEVLKAHPELMGKADVANNVAGAKSGIQQVYGGSTNLKADQKISAPPTFKAGDQREKNGVMYVRDESGKWHPKPKN